MSGPPRTIDPTFWRGRRVFVTGHTGFKGSWLTLWLQRLGAEVAGYALAPATRPSLFELADLATGLRDSVFADIRDRERLEAALQAHEPEVVFHLAAQPIVRTSYEEPLETFSVNALGTATLLDAVRHVASVRAVVAITSDKCYENVEWEWGYRETDRLGGADPYSASKACAELVIDAYRRSFFTDHGRAAVASTRAGNVIGGGDWSRDRLVPDLLGAIGRGETLSLRNPAATRPWQHVLDPLHGYLMLAERLLEDGTTFAEAWNFGPGDEAVRSVRWVVERLLTHWEIENGWSLDDARHPHEATLLRLDSSRARARLGWRPVLELDTALAWIVAWERARRSGTSVRATTLAQIEAFETSALVTA